jgi:hypothetical protein
MSNSLTLEKLINYVENLSINLTNDTTSPKNTDNVNNSTKLNTSLTKFAILNAGNAEPLINLPDELKKILTPFTQDLYRYGIHVTHCTSQYTHDISIYNSVLSCIDPEFMQLIEDDKILYINNFVNIFHFDFMKETKKTRLKINDEFVKGKYLNHNKCEYYDQYGLDANKIVKKKVLEDIKQYNVSDKILQILAGYFSVNIFIIDVANKKIVVSHNDEYYNKYKSCIILSYTDTYYEPIFYKDSKILKYNNELIQHLTSYNLKNIFKLTLHPKKKSTYEEMKNQKEEITKYLSYETITKINNVLSEPTVELPSELTAECPEIVLDNSYTELPDEEISDDGIDITDLNDDDETDALNNNNDIFCKKSNPTICDTITPLSLKMKLSELQQIAMKYKIKTKQNADKNGKVKFKTKLELYNKIKDKIGL